MKLYENLIELSDEHLCWKLHNPNLNENESENLYRWLIDETGRRFKSIYGVDFYMMGRSGRHICVDNTPRNRQSYCRMKRTIERLQNWMIEVFAKVEKL